VRGPAWLAFVLVVGFQAPATARELVTLTCFDGQVGTVVISEGGVSGASASPRCDSGAEDDGVCLFSFCPLLGCRIGCGHCPRPRRVRVGHLKWYRRKVLVCEPPQFCATDADCIQPLYTQCAPNHCVGTVEPGIFGRCQRDPACPF